MMELEDKIANSVYSALVSTIVSIPRDDLIKHYATHCPHTFGIFNTDCDSDASCAVCLAQSIGLKPTSSVIDFFNELSKGVGNAH